MNRRNFLKYSGSLASTIALPFSFPLAARNSLYEGKLLITIQVIGAWDVTSFCDPKMNVAGENKINNWADSDETQSIGNILYAPFAGNQTFFEKHYKDMLIINGIDHQTNSHSAGQTQSFTGRLSAGYPTLAALHAGSSGEELPLIYISNGGFTETAGLVRPTSLQEPDTLSAIINPNRPPSLLGPRLHPDDYELLNVAQNLRLEILSKASNSTSRQRKNRQNFLSATLNSTSLEAFKLELDNAGQIEAANEDGSSWSNLARQAQLALIAMKAGLTVSADLNIGGFDTHAYHDGSHSGQLRFLTQDVEKLWNYAEAYGLADRLTVLIKSDFGRTPSYNEFEGKDHWPIGSVIIMEKNAPWGNRIVGYTDEGHYAYNINPRTLQRDDVNGTRIHPKHIMQSLRKYLGIEQHNNATKFAFDDVDDFDFFNPALSTAQMSDPRNSIRV